MIKAMATDGTGKKVLVLGLSFANLDKFRAEPGDTYIRIIGRELGLPIDIMLISGETEAHLAETLAGGIGPDTKVHVSRGSKN
jgi:hypothetical protein